MPPSSAVRWRFVSQATNHSEDLEETGLMLGGTNEPVTAELNIPSVKRSQAGTYRCVVMNELGAVMSSVNPLTVLCTVTCRCLCCPSEVAFFIRWYQLGSYPRYSLFLGRNKSDFEHHRVCNSTTKGNSV